MHNDIPDTVAIFLLAEGFGSISDVQMLTGGIINQTCRITTSSKASFIVKQNASSPVRLFECEADGLQMLNQAGMRTPKVWAVGTDFLLLEDLGSHDDIEPDWERFGQA